jgi:hypothetical protein
LAACASQPSQNGREKIGFVSQNRRSRFSPLLLRRLSKPDTWSATVLVDELEARGIVNLVFQVAITRADDVQGVVQTDQFHSVSWEKRACSAPATVLDEVQG